ncbi:unnamed protein product [Ectocarpus sp. 4 AP-2014]
MSPDQKRQLVHLIKDNNPGARTLAVGDGANDVPMIQAAHVGVGISGQEGLQAVNASDYSLAQFRFLQKLLLCHGRFNYRRMSFATSYLFYKSVSWAVPLFVYAFFNGLSGQFFYDWVNSMLWALLYTGLPIVLLGVYDMDVLPSTALRYPWLYRNGVDDELLTKKFFWGWIAQGVLESCWVTIPLIFLQMGGPVFKGETPSVLGFGHTAFQSMTLVVNMKLLFVQKRWHWVEAALLTVSTALLFIMSWLLNISVYVSTIDWEWFGVQTALFKDPNYWAVTIFGVLGVLMRDVAWKGYHRWWNPKLHHVLVEMEKGHLEDIDLPRSLRRSYSLHQVIQEDTSTRVSKMRTQSIRRMEDHRDAVIQALGASGSGAGRNYQAASPDMAPDASARARQSLDAVVSEGGRPRSAGGRLTSISSMLEGLSRSPMSTQLSTTGSNRRGRSAGSSPILPGMTNAFSESSTLPSAGGRGEGVVVRYRSSGDLSLMGREGSGGGGRGGTAGAKAGFAFSHDEAASHRQIEMIMRNRPSHTRRRSMQPASKLPPINDSFQAHLRALKAHKAAIIADTNADEGNADARGGQVAASNRVSGHDNSAGSSRSFSLADSSFDEDGEVGGLAVVQEDCGDHATAIAPAAAAAAASAEDGRDDANAKAPAAAAAAAVAVSQEDDGDDATAIDPATAAAAAASQEDGGDYATVIAPAATAATAAASVGDVDGATGDTARGSGDGEEQPAAASVGDVDGATGDDETAVAPGAAAAAGASVGDVDAGSGDTAGVSGKEQQSKRISLRDVLSSLLSGHGTAGAGGHSSGSDGDGGNRRESTSSPAAVLEPPDESE